VYRDILFATTHFMDIRTIFVVYGSKNIMELFKNGVSEVYLNETGLVE